MNIRVNNKIYKVKRSNREGKKYRVDYENEAIHFGASGYRIRPGTASGDSYCARSHGIGRLEDPSSANFWSRKMWRCEGKKSRR